MDPGFFGGWAQLENKYGTDSGLYAITNVCGPKDMSQEKYILI